MSHTRTHTTLETLYGEITFLRHAQTHIHKSYKVSVFTIFRSLIPLYSPSEQIITLWQTLRLYQSRCPVHQLKTLCKNVFHCIIFLPTPSWLHRSSNKLIARLCSRQRVRTSKEASFSFNSDHYRTALIYHLHFILVPQAVGQSGKAPFLIWA